jgi:hypothetical protein
MLDVEALDHEKGMQREVSTDLDDSDARKLPMWFTPIDFYYKIPGMG